MEEVNTKNKFTQWCSHILMSIFISSMKVIKTGQKYFLWIFWGFLITIIFDVKIDINMCEPHYVNLFFVNLLHSPCIWLFDIWHLFDIWAIGHMGNGHMVKGVSWSSHILMSICKSVWRWPKLVKNRVGVTSPGHLFSFANYFHSSFSNKRRLCLHVKHLPLYPIIVDMFARTNFFVSYTSWKFLLRLTRLLRNVPSSGHPCSKFGSRTKTAVESLI